MDMKPEYNYGTQNEYMFRIDISGQRARAEPLIALLREVTDRYYHAQWKQWPSNMTHFTRDETQRQLLTEGLENLGIPFTVDTEVVYQIFDTQVFPNMYFLDTDLPDISEYSLALWAEANHIVEAYRLAESYSRYMGCSIFRVWSAPEPAGVIKNGDRLYVRQHPVLTGAEQWQALSNYLAQSFWKPSWEQKMPRPDMRVLDGGGFILEGYRDKTHKVSYFENPDPTNPAYEALRFLYNLFPTMEPSFIVCEELRRLR